ncbi:hypothetical protein GAY28_36135 [Azospirillum brasilense]|nr:hypothetical protein [Azospirillum brasilense]
MAAAGLARFDADGRLIWANAAFRASLGGCPGDRLDALLAALPLREDAAAAAERLRAGETVALAVEPYKELTLLHIVRCRRAI